MYCTIYILDWINNLQGDYDAGYLYECEFLNDDEKKKKSKDQLYEPNRCVPVRDSNDVPIHSLGFRFVFRF